MFCTLCEETHNDLFLILQLSFQARQQAILLPAELAGRVASRVVARTIRGSIPRNGSSGRFSSKVILSLLFTL